MGIFLSPELDRLDRSIERLEAQASATDYSATIEYHTRYNAALDMQTRCMIALTVAADAETDTTARLALREAVITLATLPVMPQPEQAAERQQVAA